MFRSKETWQCDVDQFLFQKGEALTAQVGLDWMETPSSQDSTKMQIVTTRTFFPFLGIREFRESHGDDLCICHCYWATGVTSKRIGNMSPVPHFFSHFSLPSKLGLVEADHFLGVVEKLAIWSFVKVTISKGEHHEALGKMVRITQEWMKPGELSS